ARRRVAVQEARGFLAHGDVALRLFVEHTGPVRRIALERDVDDALDFLPVLRLHGQSGRRAVDWRKFAQQQEPRLEPIAFHGARRDAEQLRDFALAESAEKAELDDLAQPLADPLD